MVVVCVCVSAGESGSSPAPLDVWTAAPEPHQRRGRGLWWCQVSIYHLEHLFFHFFLRWKLNIWSCFLCWQRRERKKQRGLFSGNTRARFMLVFLLLLLLHFLWPVCVCVSVNHILPPKIKFHVCVLISLIYLYWLTGQGGKKQATTTVC